MIKKIIIMVALALVLLTAACVTPANPCCETQRSMTVNGTGTVTLVPDVAYINIGVRTESDEVGIALKGNTSKATKISEALTKLGVEAKDIQTTSFNVYPMQRYSDMGEMIGTYYAVENTVAVTVRNLDKTGDILDAVIEAGANNIYGITFDVEDKTPALEEARQLAIADAKARASEIAAEAGVTLSDVTNVGVWQSGGATPYYEKSMGYGGSYDMAAAVPVSAGSLVITVEASITYTIK